MIKKKWPSTQKRRPVLLAMIDVVDSNTGSILASRKISNRDFSRPQSYQVFRLPLILRGPTDIGFKVHNKGSIELFFDKVSVRREAEINP